MRRMTLEATDKNVLQTIENDKLQRTNDIISFVNILESIDYNAFVSIDAGWGNGKSFFVRQTEMTLRYHNKIKFGEQEAVNTLVEEGMMHVNFSTKAYFDGKISTKFNIKNIENNHDSIVFEIFDEDGNSLYKSKKIAPGYEMTCIELDKELSKGRHECSIEIQYAVEGYVSTVFPIVLIVE